MSANRTLRDLGIGLAIAAALVGVAFYVGRLVERSHWNGQVAQVDTVYVASVVRDTVYLTVQKPHWDTVRVRDTITVNKVVYVPLASADSAVHACEAGYAACRAARDTLYDANLHLRSQVQALETSASKCGVSVAVGTGVAATYDLFARRLALGPSLYGGLNLACKKLF